MGRAKFELPPFPGYIFQLDKHYIWSYYTIYAGNTPINVRSSSSIHILQAACPRYARSYNLHSGLRPLLVSTAYAFQRNAGCN